MGYKAFSNSNIMDSLRKILIIGRRGMDLKEYLKELDRFNKLKRYISENKSTLDVLKYLNFEFKCIILLIKQPIFDY